MLATKAVPKRTRRPSVTQVDFVKAWVAGKNLQEISLALGVTVSAVSTRGAKMKKAGVNLPDRESIASTRLNPERVAELNKLCS